MNIAQAVKVSRKDRGLQQDELGIPYSKSMVSMVERGEREIAPDVAPVLVEKLDHPALVAEMVRTYTGFSLAWLDGANVDLHRASVREKCLEELREAMDAIGAFSAYIPPHAQTESERKARQQHLLQVMDSIQACFMYVGVQCLDYDYSLLQVSKEHHAKLKGRRYVTA